MVTQRCLFMSMSGETKMFINDIYLWWQKDDYLYLCVLVQIYLLIYICLGKRMFIYVTSVWWKKIFFYVIYVLWQYFVYEWWHKDIYLYQCVVELRYLFIPLMCNGANIFIYYDVWGHKNIYLYLYLVKQRCLLMASLCVGERMFIYIYL